MRVDQGLGHGRKQEPTLANGGVGGLTKRVFSRQRTISLLLAASIASPAFAYIDPNIGGQIYQALYPILAVLLGVVAFARQWIAAIWHRFATAVRSLFSR